MSTKLNRRIEKIEGDVAGLGVALELTHITGDVFESDDGGQFLLGEVGDLLLRNRAVILYRSSSDRLDLEKIFRLGPAAFEQAMKKYTRELEIVLGKRDKEDSEDDIGS